MKLMVGLGNPGEKYQNNRHNVGHMFVTYLQDKKPDVSSDLLIKKSDVFMNDSGRFVKKLVDQYGINTPELWVIHDDLDIPLGSYKIQFGVGPKDHNGINSIERELGTKDFWRIRVGIENRHGEIADSISRGPMRGAKRSLMGGEEYVLKDFNEEELKILSQVFFKITEELFDRMENE